MSVDILPTRGCTPELHEKYGGACYWCCGTCDQDRHVCHFCGDSLRHDGRLHSGEINTCYTKCECGHIGHEHFADSCRGGEVRYLEMTVGADCDCTSYRPMATDTEETR